MKNKFENFGLERAFMDRFGKNIRNCKCECHYVPTFKHESKCLHCDNDVRNKKIIDFILYHKAIWEQKAYNDGQRKIIEF